MKLCMLDFEFNDINERRLNLVSVAAKCTDGTEMTYQRFFWLHQVRDAKLAEARSFFLNRIREGYVFVSYVLEAEVRGLMALFKDDDIWMQGFRAVDLYLEYRCLLNHNHLYAYGKQFIKGKVITTSPPPNKWEVQGFSAATDDDEAHHKPSFSMAACVYKLLGEKVDTNEKTRVRDIIIRSNPDEINAAAADIEAYNVSDIRYLPQLLQWFRAYYAERSIGEVDFWTKAALSRGDYALRTARMIRLGYPVNNGRLALFTENITEILKKAAEQCNEAADPALQPFRKEKKTGRYVMTEKNLRAWVAAQGKPYWRKTDGKALSLSKDAFSDWYSSSSEGFAGAFCRYLKTKQSLNGFLPGEGKRGKFKDFVGRDGRVRPFFGIYGSQSSRSQPGATGFIPLKAHWMRTFLEAPAGGALAGIDYASQEFLIAALLSQDQAMIDAYQSGDVYLAFAKEAQLVPRSATKKTHAVMREVCKAMVLGISYDMSARGLAPRLTQVADRAYGEEEAQGLINAFYSVYPDYAGWKRSVQKDYEESGSITLPDGWVMWGDNDNPRSVGNFPVQGHGAVVMREAVRRAQDRGLDVIFTLHDALYIEYTAYDVGSIELLKLSMAEAFEAVMAPYGATVPIRLEGESWCPEYEEKKPADVENVLYLGSYIDDKGRDDYHRYKEYFTAKPATEEKHNGLQKSLRGAQVL